MEKILKKIVLPAMVIALSLTIGVSVSAQEIRERLAGRILLQVEDSGAAWYVDPLTKTKVALGRPADALNAMRRFGLGVKNVDLEQIALSTDTAARVNSTSKRLAGRILLQVEENGEAWYINPVNFKRYSLGTPQQALDVMRELGLGIRNVDIDKIPTFTSDGLTTRLLGRILLQVEENGEAWYVDPVSRTRVFLGRPADALNVMRELGLGITNEDLAQIAISNETSRNNVVSRRVAGRILLQVEENGEAWYVSPVDLKRYSLGNPQQALTVMRNLGLGITNANLDKITVRGM